MYAVLLGCLRKSISRILVLIVSMGFGVVLPYLGAIQHKVGRPLLRTQHVWRPVFHTVSHFAPEGTHAPIPEVHHHFVRQDTGSNASCCASGAALHITEGSIRSLSSVTRLCQPAVGGW
jgi:hypothetical protein